MPLFVKTPHGTQTRALGAFAIIAVSTTTASGLRGNLSTEIMACEASYIAMRDEVGLSFEAIVGTVTTGRPSLSAIPFAASSDLPSSSRP